MPGLDDLLRQKQQARGGSGGVKPAKNSPAPSPTAVGLEGLLQQKRGTTPATLTSTAPEAKGSWLSRAAKDLQDTVGNVPRGLVAFGAGVGRELYGIGRGTVDPHWRDKRPGETTAERDARVYPITSGLVHSFGNTASRLGGAAVAAAPGGQPFSESRLVKDYSQRPVSSLVEDAANLSIVLGPLAEAAGTVGEGSKAATTLGKAARATKAVAEAPAVPFQLAGRAAGGAGRAAYEAAAASEGTVGKTLRALELDPQSRLTRKALVEGEEKLSEGTGRQVALGQRLEQIVPDHTEQAATFLVGEGEAPVLAQARAALPVDLFERWAARRYGDAALPAVRLAADVTEGKAPEAAARIGEALKVGNEAAGGRLERQAAYLAAKPGRDWQTGFAPRTEAIDQATEQAMRGLPKASRLADAARRHAEDASARLLAARSTAQVEHLDRPAGVPTFGVGRRVGRLETRARVAENVAKSAEARLGKLQANVQVAAQRAAADVRNAPARLRPALAAARSAEVELRAHAGSLRAAGDEASAGLVERAAGELPTTLKALQANGVNVDHFVHVKTDAKPSGSGVSGESLPRFFKARSEKQRLGSTGYERTFKAQAKGEIDELKATVARETQAKIAALPFAQKVRSLDEVPAGYVLWDAASPFEKAATVTKNSVAVPEHVFQNFRRYWTDPKWDSVLNATYDSVLRTWKMFVLPLSPSWHVGNVAGNMLLATLGAGVGPVRLAKGIAQAVGELRRTGELGGPRRLYTAGPTHAEFEWLANAGRGQPTSRLGRAAQRIASPGTAFVRKSYAANAFVDDIGRTAVYLAKKGEGLSEEAALRESLKAMGDFSRMTPFERRVVKRVVPFWAWQRHMTQLAFRLPVEHPLRVAWTLHLADQYGQPDAWMDGLPDDQRASIPLGNRLLGTRSAFPFGDAGRILTPTGLRQSLSPAIKIAEQSRTGINQLSGRPFTRPPGTGRVDAYGRELPTAPSVAKQVTDAFPQKRLLESLQGRSDVVRYDSGDKVLTRRGTIPNSRSKGESLLRFLGVPLTDRASAQAQAARVEQKRIDLRRAAERYRRRQRQP